MANGALGQATLRSCPIPPAIFSVPVAFFGIWSFSVTDRSPLAAVDRAGFTEQEIRSETGVGAYQASAH